MLLTIKMLCFLKLKCGFLNSFEDLYCFEEWLGDSQILQRPCNKDLGKYHTYLKYAEISRISMYS